MNKKDQKSKNSLNKKIKLLEVKIDRGKNNQTYYTTRFFTYLAVLIGLSFYNIPNLNYAKVTFLAILIYVMVVTFKDNVKISKQLEKDYDKLESLLE